jgi:hypothetical protein
MKDKIVEQLLAIREVIKDVKDNDKDLHPEIGESLNVYRDLVLNTLSDKKKAIMKKNIKPLDSKENCRIDTSLALSVVDQLLLLKNGTN